MDDIVYFYVEEDWRSVTPEIAKNFCKWLEKGDELQICVAIRDENLTKHIWVTCKKEFIDTNFPELTGTIKTRPWYSEFLIYREENFGIHHLEPKNPEKDITDHVY